MKLLNSSCDDSEFLYLERMSTHKTPDDLIAAFPYQFPLATAHKVIFSRETFEIMAALCTEIDAHLGFKKREFHWTDTRKDRLIFHIIGPSQAIAHLCYQARESAAKHLRGRDSGSTNKSTYTNEPLAVKWWAPESEQLMNPDQLITALSHQFLELGNLTFISGWHPTFATLCFAIDAALGTERETRVFHWTQLKSKFGQARWYWSMKSSAKAPIRISQQQPDGSFKMLTNHQSTDPVWQTVSDLVDAAQARANECCEVCGVSAEIGSHGGRYSTLCKDHAMMESKNQPLPLHFWSPTGYSADAKWWTA